MVIEGVRIVIELARIAIWVEVGWEKRSFASNVSAYADTCHTNLVSTNSDLVSTKCADSNSVSTVRIAIQSAQCE